MIFFSRNVDVSLLDEDWERRGRRRAQKMRSLSSLQIDVIEDEGGSFHSPSFSSSILTFILNESGVPQSWARRGSGAQAAPLHKLDVASSSSASAASASSSTSAPALRGEGEEAVHMQSFFPHSDPRLRRPRFATKRPAEANSPPKAAENSRFRRLLPEAKLCFF